MSRFVHIDYPTQHPGVARLERSAETLNGFHPGRALVAALAYVGAPIQRATVGVRASLAAWSERRRQAEQDRRLWEVALRDARVMADLSRAMSAEALNSLKNYY